MPLSEHEQRLLEEMERSLYHNDADYVAHVGVRKGRPPYRSIVLGVLIAVLGIAALVAGVSLQIAVIGIVGFVAMFAGVLLAITPPKRTMRDVPGEQKPAGAPSKAGGQPGLMDKLNDRWDKRQDGHG